MKRITPAKMYVAGSDATTSSAISQTFSDDVRRYDRAQGHESG
jgi:hypothetical protein